MTWSPPEETNGELVQYILDYGIVNDSSSMKSVEMSALQTHMNLENLKEKMLYIFKVKAATSAGAGKFSKISLFRMDFEGNFHIVV